MASFFCLSTFVEVLVMIFALALFHGLLAFFVLWLTSLRNEQERDSRTVVPVRIAAAKRKD